MPASDFSTRDCASILNAYTRLRHPDPPLFRHLGRCMFGARGAHNLQTLASSLNSFAHALRWLPGGEALTIFARISDEVIRLPSSQLDPVGVGVLLSSLAKAEHDDRALLEHLFAAILSWPASTTTRKVQHGGGGGAKLSPKTVSTLLSAAAGLNIADTRVGSSTQDPAHPTPYTLQLNPLPCTKTSVPKHLTLEPSTGTSVPRLPLTLHP